MKFAGFCLGASSISVAVVDKDEGGRLKLAAVLARNHEGLVVETLRSFCAEPELANIAAVSVTGRKFRTLVPVAAVSEGEAIEVAYHWLQDEYPAVDTIVSAGAEAFIAYRLDARGRIVDVFTGNKCASGTGEFFLQQVKRMGYSPEEALRNIDVEDPYQVAGRCSVFCKSDCTHALNKGEAKSSVIGGLCWMMAGKISELAQRGKAKKIMLIGGTAQNAAMVGFLRREAKIGQEIIVPEQAGYFEALGAALWAVEHGSPAWKSPEEIIAKAGSHSSFDSMPDLRDFVSQVTFKEILHDRPCPGDECIIGLDVGSTTTKAVVLRTVDNAILAAEYLRTNGDPIKAAKECYASLAGQIDAPVIFYGIGVTGSGRQIAGLHAGSSGIINEIIAHAAAAAYFDREADTLFEIGGQDAKYTYIRNGVPADYAMNEACSAGTGSFLEEAAKEALQIEMQDIADIAMRSSRPLNFNDQCAAFIGSDIKTAIQEGVSREDIVAGLVYSVCQNYVNRVKGNRPVGGKVFMQGGVCYNRAVPAAMAALTGKPVVVAPEPGLMGAFGVALVIKEKLATGLMERQSFDLLQLSVRTVEYGTPFVCAGGPEQCDRKCEIKMINVEGAALPFGGACNRYVNLRRKLDFNVEALDRVRARERLLFAEYAPQMWRQDGGSRIRIGLLKSLIVNSLFPLYHRFFAELGCEVVLADLPDPSGMEKTGAAFCYPVELAHCFMVDLLKRKTDYIFLPHVVGLRVENGITASVNCPLLQGEPYFLRTAFSKELSAKNVLCPTLDFCEGYGPMEAEFVNIGRELGCLKDKSVRAYHAAIKAQAGFIAAMKEEGRSALADLEAHHEKIGIVMFGRAYSAFTKEANMGIPHKFASRGYAIVPWECLPLEDEPPVSHMFWSVGQMMLKAAKFVERHPQLFAAYITNFSCGPDSFVIGYFRDIMGKKPNLILELDSHVADAGIDTRVEAFLDVVAGYREQQTALPHEPFKPDYRQAQLIVRDGETFVVDSHGKKRALTDPGVHLILVSMGSIQTRTLAAAFRHVGIRAGYLQPPGRNEMNCGRSHSTCKECLPYVLVAGSILDDLAVRRQSGFSPGDVMVYFLPDSSGPCRFGQYHVAIRHLLAKRQVENVTMFSPTSDNGYAGLTTKFQNQAWQAVIIGDVLAEIYSAVLVLARDREAALATFGKVVDSVEAAIAADIPRKKLHEALKEQARILAGIPLKTTLAVVPKVALVGEIFVRTDSFSRQRLVERMADRGILVQVAPVSEYMYYCDYLMQKSLYHVKPSVVEKMMSVVRSYVKGQMEKTLKDILADSGLYETKIIDIDNLVGKIRHLIPPHFTAGETVLTVASSIHDMLDHVSGVVSIGPFGCMPGRVGDAILSESLNDEKRKQSGSKPWVAELMQKHPSLPFLSLESDGNPFPQIIEAKLELFCLQVLRVHETRRKMSRL